MKLHFLVPAQSVTQSCSTLCDPMGRSLPGSSVHGIFQARILEWVAIFSSGDLPDPEIELKSPALASGFFTTEPESMILIGGYYCAQLQSAWKQTGI